MRRRDVPVDALDLALDALEDARRREDAAMDDAEYRQLMRLVDAGDSRHGGYGHDCWDGCPEWFPAPMPEVGPVDQEEG
jgi:hypothetical protein